MIDIKKLYRRCSQTTDALMREVGLKAGGYAHRNIGAPVLAIAHCDYVGGGSDHFFRRGNRVYSSRLDDRLGVHILLDILPGLGIDVDILLTDDEEKGDSTAQFFRPESHDYNWIFSFDRRGIDAVVYEYDCMRPYASEYFRIGTGSFSDISFLEHLGVGCVNIGTAYYKEHTLGCYAVLSEINDQVERFTRMYSELSGTRIPHYTRCTSGTNGIFGKLV